MHNRIEIIGNVSNNIELRHTPTGQAVCSFYVATNHKYKKSDGTPAKETTWFRINAWGNLAEICAEYLYKGCLVFISGKLVANEDGNPPISSTLNKKGEAFARFEIKARKVLVLHKNEITESEKVFFEDEDD